MKSVSNIVRTLSLVTVAIAILTVAPAAQGNPITCATDGAALVPGTFVLPGDCTGVAAGTLLASEAAPFTSSLGLDSGTLVSAVYEESGGTLDFYYQVVLNTTSTNCGGAGQVACDPLGRETDTSFTGFATSVDTRADGSTLPGGIFVDGTAIPVSVDRNGVGDVVGFSFTPPNSSEIQPGQTSEVLVIATDATKYTAGNSSVIDGGVTTVASFEPMTAASVPEPTTFGFLALGCGAMLVVRKRVRRQTNS